MQQLLVVYASDRFYSMFDNEKAGRIKALVLRPKNNYCGACFGACFGAFGRLLRRPQ